MRLYILPLLALLPLAACQDQQSSKVSEITTGDHKVCLDGKDVDSKKKFHQSLAKQADFPAFYGENLDALWDVLTSRTDLTRVTWYNYEASEKSINEEEPFYFQQIQKVFKDAAGIGARAEIKLVTERESPENPCAETSTSIPQNPGEAPIVPVFTDPEVPVFN